MSPLHFHSGQVATRSVVLAVALGVLLPGIGAANQGVYKRGMLSVVWILRKIPGGVSSGSGFLVNEREKIVVTNYHVVGEASEVVVFVPAYRGNELITEMKHYVSNAAKIGLLGKVVARSKSQDLALIRLPTLPRGLSELPLAKRSPKPGQTLNALGNSGGLDEGTLWRYSKGTVREVARLVRKFPLQDKVVLEVDVKWVDTQMPINSGDSGGPVLNERGELAAVVQGVLANKTLVTYTIDVSEVRALLAKEKLLPKRKTASSTRKGRD